MKGRNRDTDREKGHVDMQWGRERGGIKWQIGIGLYIRLTKECIQVFPLYLTEKLKGIFCPTKYIIMRKRDSY